MKKEITKILVLLISLQVGVLPVAQAKIIRGKATLDKAGKKTSGTKRKTHQVRFEEVQEALMVAQIYIDYANQALPALDPKNRTNFQNVLEKSEELLYWIHQNTPGLSPQLQQGFASVLLLPLVKMALLTSNLHPMARVLPDQNTLREIDEALSRNIHVFSSKRGYESQIFVNLASIPGEHERKKAYTPQELLDQKIEAVEVRLHTDEEGNLKPSGLLALEVLHYKDGTVTPFLCSNGKPCGHQFQNGKFGLTANAINKGMTKAAEDINKETWMKTGAEWTARIGATLVVGGIIWQVAKTVGSGSAWGSMAKRFVEIFSLTKSAEVKAISLFELMQAGTLVGSVWYGGGELGKASHDHFSDLVQRQKKGLLLQNIFSDLKIDAQESKTGEKAPSLEAFINRLEEATKKIGQSEQLMAALAEQQAQQEGQSSENEEISRKVLSILAQKLDEENKKREKLLKPEVMPIKVYDLFERHAQDLSFEDLIQVFRDFFESYANSNDVKYYIRKASE